MPVKQGVNRDSKGKFTKGTSGNSAGRPGKGETLTEILREYGEERIKLGGKTKPAREHLAEQVYTAILQGYRLVDGKKVTLSNASWVTLLIFLYDRVDGKPTENIQINSPEVELTSEDFTAAAEELVEWREKRGLPKQ